MLAILAILIFTAETIAMIVLYFLDLPDYFWTSLIDGSLMLILIMPGLYYFQMRPLLTQIEIRDRVERELRANEGFLRQGIELQEKFFSSISTLIAYMDRDFNFIRVNDSYAQGGGHPPDYYIGRNHFDLYPNEENEAIFKNVVATGEPFSVLEKEFQYHEYPERGTSYWDWSLQPVRGEGEMVEGLVLSLVDVTERKLAENNLAQRNEELRALYQSESTARQFAETLSNASQALTESLDLDTVLHTLLEHLSKILPADMAFVTLLEGETGLAVRAAWAASDQPIQQESLSYPPFNHITDSVLQRLKMTRKSMVIPSIDARMGGEHTDQLDAIHSWLIVPIIAGQKTIGLVELGRTNGDEFTSAEASWAEAVSYQAAVAIQNAWLFEQTRSSSERLQSLTKKLVEIQENEREHIARELHDEAGQALSSLKLGLGRLEQSSECPESIKERLYELKKVTDNVLEELHRLAMDLRPVTLDHLGLVPALQQYVHKLDGKRLTIKFKAVGFDETRLPRDTETSIYRIVQEAVTNAIRHAKASQVGVLIERGRNLKVFIEDDGIGFDPAQVDFTSHMGLSGIQERAEMLGGCLTIESTPGIGTTIIVEVPDDRTDSDC